MKMMSQLFKLFKMQAVRRFSQSADIRRLHNNKKPNFGVCFDVDGVIARGPVSIPAVAEVVNKLTDHKKEWIVPVAFVTNSAVLKSERAEYISRLLRVPVRDTQVVQAISPLEVFSSLADMFCVVVGQGNLYKMADQCGLKNVCTVEEITKTFPLLDMVNSDNMSKTSPHGESFKNFPKVEAIVLFGEPINWETSLQIMIDLLRTDGMPHTYPEISNQQQLPIYACSFDLEYMSRSSIPRFGHGAFLTCLESLYKEITGRDITYSALMGKPTEVTFRYADYILNQEAIRMCASSPLEKMYMIGDAPEADIVGVNLYKKYLKSLELCRMQGNSEKDAMTLVNETFPQYRQVPLHSFFLNRTVKSIEGCLVCTGVYKKGDKLGIMKTNNQVYQKSLFSSEDLEIPDNIFDDVDDAVNYILQKEKFNI